MHTNNKKMNPNDIYTSLGEAEAEIKKRHNDPALKKRLEDFWGENKPNFICETGPRAVLSKSIITPNKEFKYFLDVSNILNLDKCFFEYHRGKFVGKNQEKRHLGKMFFHHGKGKKNGDKTEHISVVDFNKHEGKKMSEVDTVFDKKMVDFHHELINKSLPNEKFNLTDISEWFDKTRYLDAYYVYYLSLFIRDHILFENFLFDEKEESKFTLDKFLPSFEKVTKIFGVKPIIVPLLPHEHEKNDLWFSYDEDVQKKVKAMLIK